MVVGVAVLDLEITNGWVVVVVGNCGDWEAWRSGNVMVGKCGGWEMWWVGSVTVGKCGGWEVWWLGSVMVRAVVVVEVLVEALVL